LNGDVNKNYRLPIEELLGNIYSNTAENEKADLTSAFGVCPFFGATTLSTSSEARFSQRAYTLKGFPFLCFVLSGLNPFQDSCGFPNPIRLIS